MTCRFCNGSGILSRSKDPDEVVECVCTDPPPIGPDCRDGKCAACIGDAFDFLKDEPTRCGHECHAPTKG